jgi:hypothetical protein
MSFLQRLSAILFAALLLPAAAVAAPQDAVMNKEGSWGIDVDHGACAASMTLQGGSTFLLRALDGQVTFALFSLKPLAKGKVVRLETEAYGFDFKAEYGEDATSLFYGGEMDARALAALRLARQVSILADGRPVASMTVEGTGLEGALDGVIACSKGQSGWWSKGAGAEPAEGPERVFNEEGFWSVSVNDPGVCSARIEAEDHRQLQILAGAGGLALVVTSNGTDLAQGRDGKVETDAYAFAFKPIYGGKRWVATDKALDSQALFALARARTVRVSVDGRELLVAAVGSTGFPDVLTSVAACARGEKGWWGAGAPPR